MCFFTPNHVSMKLQSIVYTCIFQTCLFFENRFVPHHWVHCCKVYVTSSFSIMARKLDCTQLGDYSRLCLSHLIRQSKWRRAQDDIKMASVNPACRLQTATQVRLRGSSQILCSVTQCTQKHSAFQWCMGRNSYYLPAISTRQSRDQGQNNWLTNWLTTSHIFLVGSCSE